MRVVRVFVIALLVAGVANAQKQKLKVYISADMEGIGGVITDVQADPKGHEYEKFRRLMTEEVNAAIAGAYDAGATEVLVNDGHGDSQNIDLELLDKRQDVADFVARPAAVALAPRIDVEGGTVVVVEWTESLVRPAGRAERNVAAHDVNDVVGFFDLSDQVICQGPPASRECPESAERRRSERVL